jgi:hypothetical protein
MIRNRSDPAGRPVAGDAEIYRVLARLMQTDLTVMIPAKPAPGKPVARALPITASGAPAHSSRSIWRRFRATPIESELFGRARRVHWRQYPCVRPV